MPKEPRRPVLTDENQDDVSLLEPYEHEESGVVMWYQPFRNFDLGDRITAAIEAYKEHGDTGQIEAILLTCVNVWNVRVPKTFKARDEEGKIVPHPLAGQVAPITVEWLRKLDPAIVVDACVKIGQKYQGRSAEEQTEFPGPDTASDVPEDRESRGGAGDGDSGDGAEGAAA